MKIVYYHLATSSLNPNSAEILQIGAKCNRENDPNLFNVYIFPYKMADSEIKDGSLKRHGLNIEKLRELNAVHPMIGLTEFLNYLKKNYGDEENVILVFCFRPYFSPNSTIKIPLLI